MVVVADRVPREVAAQVAVVGVFPTLQPDLGAIVELWNAAHREQRAQAELRDADGPVEPGADAGVLGPRVAHDAPLEVVVVQQRDEPVRVAVSAFEGVVVVEHTQRLVVVQSRPGQPVANALIVDQRRAQRRARRKVEDRVEIVVVLVLQERGDVVLALEQHLADQAHIGMLAAICDLK